MPEHLKCEVLKERCINPLPLRPVLLLLDAGMLLLYTHELNTENRHNTRAPVTSIVINVIPTEKCCHLANLIA